jgi:glycosyltransferase involved in cell wall biosynthesis
MLAYRVSRELVARGFEVTVYTNGLARGVPGEETMEGIDVHRIGSGEWGLRGSCITLPWMVYRNRKQFDTVLVVGFDLFTFFSGIAGKLARKKIYVRLASSTDLKFDFPELRMAMPNQLIRWVYAGIKEIIIKALVRIVDGWIAISREIEAEMERVGIEERKIFHIPNGVDIRLFHPVDPETKVRIRRALSLPESGLIVLYCGRIVKLKRLDLLLEEFSKLASEHMDIFLVLVGSGNRQIDSAEDIVASYIYRPEGRYIWIKDTDCPEKYYQASDIFVLPSEREGMPNVLLEAMSSGVACIASAVGGILDIVQDGENGLMFRTREELKGNLKKLILEKYTRDVLSIGARNSILDKYDICIISMKYSRLFS